MDLLDVLELGVPFSDPMADGPVVQRSGERALKLGVGLKDVLGMVRAFRRLDANTPLVLMGYANPIEAIVITSYSIHYTKLYDEAPSEEEAPSGSDLSGISLDLGGAESPGGGGDAKWQEVATKLDLAKAYEEMGDKDGARELSYNFV